ncbi:MAG: DMT family transporter [Silicimonas sp.]|nr:DMT family transporter [Silicimonas sp.]
MADHPTNGRAIALLVASMAAFAAVDGFVKLASPTQSAAQILLVSSSFTFLVYGVMMWREKTAFFTRQALSIPLLWRSFGEVTGSYGIVLALGLAPLPTVMALAQAQPLAVVAGAALFLGETVGWRRWMSVGFGLVGVLIILRPGLSAFEPGLLWVLVYVFGLAIRDIASRRLPGDVSTAFAVAWSMIPLIVVSAIGVVWQGGWLPVSGQVWLYYTGMSIAVSVALWTLTTAMRIGEVSAVAPFRYSRIVFALILGFVVFNEVPDALTWVGAALIVGSGIYSFWRERRRTRKG